MLIVVRPLVLLALCFAVATSQGCGSDDPPAPRDRPSSAAPLSTTPSNPAQSGGVQSKDTPSESGGARSTPAPSGGTSTTAGPSGQAPEPGGWGTLRGRVIFKGNAPQMGPLTINRDQEHCGKMPPQNESLIVASGGGIANVVVFAVADDGDPKVPLEPIHPDYEARRGDEVVFDNQFCRFEPHVQQYWTSQTLVLKNSDPMPHNTKGDPFGNRSFNPVLPPGGRMDLTLEHGERMPVRVSCTIHSWMTGFVVVRPDPYMAVSAEDGTFVIENLPTGRHGFQIWQEALANARSVTLRGGKQTDRRGIFAIDIHPGDNDVGDIVLDAADYATQLRRLR